MLTGFSKYIAFISFVIAVGVTSATLFIIYKLNVKSEILAAIINFTAVTIGGIIGGYVAYLASHKQVQSNRNIEKYKEAKKEFSACLITHENLKTTRVWLSKFNSDTTFGEVANYIDILILENFRNNYLYLLNEKDASKFCSTLNRLKLIKISDPNKVFKFDKISSLIKHLQEVDEYIDYKKSTLKYSLTLLEKKIKN